LGGVVIEHFLLNQPKLGDLGISGCFTFADSVFAALLEIITQRPITRLELRGSRTQVFGLKLLPVLQALLARCLVKKLDVSGQAIGDCGLKVVVKLAEQSLDELRFDGSQPSSHEVLIETTRRIAASKCSASEWPSDDARAVIAMIPLSNRQAVMKVVEAARKEFEQKMSSRQAEEAMPADSHAKRRGQSILHRGIRAQAFQVMAAVDKSIIGFREPPVRLALAEILGTTDIRDPMMAALEKLDAETSLDTFIEKYEALLE
jgi:hypothetical protein